MSFLPRRTIVVPVDFSDYSEPAVRVALELAAAPGDIHVVHVIPSLNPVSPRAIWGEGDVQQKLTDNASRYLETWLATHNLQGVQSQVVVGAEGTKIVELADGLEADLIVISSHGNSGLTRAVMGAVAERVTRYASCPTLVLRRPKA